MLLRVPRNIGLAMCLGWVCCVSGGVLGLDLPRMFGSLELSEWTGFGRVA
jgi:hypothetical protein